MAKYNIGVIKPSNNFFNRNILSPFPTAPITPKAIQNLEESWMNEKVKDYKFAKAKKDNLI